MDELVERARECGIETHVLREGEDSAEVARAADAGSLGMAGGDGSLAPVAEVAIERDLPFVCIPYGTRNHFARDVGFDRDDPLAALDAFSGIQRRIDVARANGKLFLNNVTMGLYAELVHRREHHRRRSDAFARLRALVLLLRHRGREEKLRIAGRPVSAGVVLVANNAYEVDLFELGERQRLDEGRLHLYIAHGWRPRTWEESAATEFEIESATDLHAAIDGEAAQLDSPARFSIEPQTLRVLLPPGT